MSPTPLVEERCVWAASSALTCRDAYGPEGVVAPPGTGRTAGWGNVGGIAPCRTGVSPGTVLRQLDRHRRVEHFPPATVGGGDLGAGDRAESPPGTAYRPPGGLHGLPGGRSPVNLLDFLVTTSVRF